MSEHAKRPSAAKQKAIGLTWKEQRDALLIDLAASLDREKAMLGALRCAEQWMVEEHFGPDYKPQPREPLGVVRTAIANATEAAQ